MRTHSGIVLILALAVAAAACTKPEDARTYTLQGQIIGIAADRMQATIKHEEIKGLMPPMTMAYKVRDVKAFDGMAPGDLINAKLIVVSNDAYLTDVKKVGTAPLETPPAGSTPTASAGFELLKPGDAVPNAKFVDENGQPRTFDSFKGRQVVMTFIYTRCPLPTFCPLMDKNFAALQKTIKGEKLAGQIHLVSVSFDPETDTPPTLKRHSRELGADPGVWTFLTGDRGAVDRFASGFGVQVSREGNDQREITHNLRTAIVDRAGTLVKIYDGNEWTPDQILADLHVD
jgi:protein SCO1/2